MHGPRRTDVSVTELTSQALISPLNELAAENMFCDTQGDFTTRRRASKGGRRFELA